MKTLPKMIVHIIDENPDEKGAQFLYRVDTDTSVGFFSNLLDAFDFVNARSKQGETIDIGVVHSRPS